MIVVRLRGGLGNQLFQYAAGRALADHHGTELKLDLYTYTRHKYRKFELDNFQLEYAVASRQEIHRFTGANMLERYLNKRENYLRCPGVFAQPHYHFYDDFFNLPSDLYLSGYWQSEKYFASVRERLKAWYEPRQASDHRNLEYLKKIGDTNSVSLHVRRGDYQSNKEYQQFYGGLREAYYHEAINKIREQVDQPVFFVFSDDIEWCRKNLGIASAVFVDINSAADAYKDLSLMARCRHNIIANSTFSWWGAWLNANPDKRIIAPRPWFRKTYTEKKEPVYPCRYYNTKDLIPQPWIQLG